MLRSTLSRTNKKSIFNNLERKIKNLSRSNVEAGFFDSQGKHPTAGMSFVDLIKIHEFGMFGVTQRMPMAKISDKAWNDFTVRSGMVISRYLQGRVSMDRFLDDIGKETNEVAYSVFGHSPPLILTQSKTPLVDTGELSDGFSWRISGKQQLRSLPDRNKGST